MKFYVKQQGGKSIPPGLCPAVNSIMGGGDPLYERYEEFMYRVVRFQNRTSQKTRLVSIFFR